MTADLGALAVEQNVPESLFTVAVMSLDKLMAEQPIALLDLAYAARDRSYKPFGDNGGVLLRAGLIETLDPDGTVTMWPSMRALYLAVTEVHDDGDVSLNLPARGGE